MGTIIEQYVAEAIAELKAGNDGDAVYHPLYKAWNGFRHNPAILKEVTDYAQFGSGMLIFLSFGTISDIDTQQQVASIAYLFLSKAIKEKANANHIKNRLLLMVMAKEPLSYTVMSILNCSMYSIIPPWMKARDAMYKMQYADMCTDSRICDFIGMTNQKTELEEKIKADFFGRGKTRENIIEEGTHLHAKLLDHLEEMVLVDEDIDF